MAKVGKKLKAAREKRVKFDKYPLDECLQIVLDSSYAKFDESIDVSIRLGVDPKQSDQQVRGAIALPHGLGKSVRVLVFSKGPKEQEAKDAGADFVGSDDLVEKIQGGWLEFDKAIATPDMMKVVSKVAKVLGPRGLMPNPKVGTVTMNIKEAVESEKKGKLAFRVEKGGIIHAGIGRKSMGKDKLKDNFLALLHTVVKAKPAAAKGIYIKAISMSSTMGPGLKLDAVNAQSQIS